MEDETMTLPAIPDGDDVLRRELDKYLMSATEDYPEPYYLLNYMGVGFSPLGGIQAVSGQKKNGKTFLLTQLMSVILEPESERVRAKLPGLALNPETLEHIGHKPVVLYVDTEMEKLNTAKVLRRVHWLCGWDLNADHERFHTLWLRTVETPQEKINIMMKAIDLFRPTAVFVDGVRDLVSDFNNLDESMPLIIRLMKTATEYDCCIWNVLHMNPRQRNDDESKMRGHLGTELGNKVTDTLASFKSKTEAGVTFKVKQLDARGKDIPDWTFEVVNDAGGLGIPRIIGGVAAPVKDVTPDEDEVMASIRIIRDVMTPPKSYRYRAILDGIKSNGGVGTKKAQRYFNICRDFGFIDDPINGLFTLNEKNIKDYEDEVPF